MITKQIATHATHGTIFHHKTATNADGTPKRCRVTGKCKTWKTRPDDFRLPVKYFRLPVKYGLRDSFYITPTNADEWSVSTVHSPVTTRMSSNDP